MADKDREDDKKDDGGAGSEHESAEKKPEGVASSATEKQEKVEAQGAEGQGKPEAPATTGTADADPSDAEGGAEKAAAGKKEEAGAKAASGKKAAEEDDEEDEEDDEEEDEPRAAKAKPTPAKRGPAPRGRRPPPKGGSLGKSLFLFVIVLGALGGAFMLLGKEDSAGQGPAPAPKWNVGQTVDLEITVVPSDAKELACASTTAIEGRKCEFETPQKPAAQSASDDKHMLKPYTTTDRVQFIAAGLWSEPSLAPTKMPATRFS